jgi:DNA-binding NtrC family response regulator
VSVINGKSILIVDDEFGPIDSLNLLLKSQGAFTVKAANGADALVILKHNTFDLITTCLLMDGINGLALIKAIRAKDVKAPIIVVTGYGGIEDEKRCLELGATDFITKPFNIEAVIKTIEKALEDACGKQK